MAAKRPEIKQRQPDCGSREGGATLSPSCLCSELSAATPILFSDGRSLRTCRSHAVRTHLVLIAVVLSLIYAPPLVHGRRCRACARDAQRNGGTGTDSLGVHTWSGLQGSERLRSRRRNFRWRRQGRDVRPLRQPERKDLHFLDGTFSGTVPTSSPQKRNAALPISKVSLRVDARISTKSETSRRARCPMTADGMHESGEDRQLENARRVLGDIVRLRRGVTPTRRRERQRRAACRSSHKLGVRTVALFPERPGELSSKQVMARDHRTHLCRMKPKRLMGLTGRVDEERMQRCRPPEGVEVGGKAA